MPIEHVGCLLLAFLVGIEGAEEPPPPRGELILVTGAAGAAEYGALFEEWAEMWRQHAIAGNVTVTEVGIQADEIDDRTRLQRQLSAAEESRDLPLWIIYLGHATDDGRTAKLNLRGPDVSSGELAAWLRGVRRPTAIVLCSSAAGRFVPALAGDRRVVICATKGREEINFSRFGGYFVTAMEDPSADLDKDEQVSLLEAFLMASREVEEFYKRDGRLATEHAVLDDTGDGASVRADVFRGIHRVDVESLEAGELADGVFAHQWHLLPSPEERELPPELARQRDLLEREVYRLRTRKQNLSEDEYYAELESLFLRLAHVYAEHEPAAEPVLPPPPPLPVPFERNSPFAAP